MKIFFDTEFIEDGRTIDLISIGLVRDDGATLYFENSECDYTRASSWVRENVLAHLAGPRVQADRASIARNVLEFVGEKPEFWAYFADYDWVVLCQLYGTMMQLPKGWPMWCRDLKQEHARFGIVDLPAQMTVEHNALADALYLKELFDRLPV